MAIDEELGKRFVDILEEDCFNDGLFQIEESRRKAFMNLIGICNEKILEAKGEDEVNIHASMCASMAVGFWLGHDYALKYGNIRGG